MYHILLNKRKLMGELYCIYLSIYLSIYPSSDLLQNHLDLDHHKYFIPQSKVLQGTILIYIRPAIGLMLKCTIQVYQQRCNPRNNPC